MTELEKKAEEYLNEYNTKNRLKISPPSKLDLRNAYKDGYEQCLKDYGII